MRFVWWDNTLPGAFGVAGDSYYGQFGAAVPTNKWVFMAARFCREGVHRFRYVPGGSVVENDTPTSPTDVIRKDITLSQPMHIGGSEVGVELMPSGTAIAELMIANQPLNPQQIRRWAHDPMAFADSLAFYAPLRYPKRVSENVGGGGVRLIFDTAAASLISSANHPPVTQRTRSVVMPPARRLVPRLDLAVTGWAGV